MKLQKARICLDCDELFVPEVVEFLGQKVMMENCPACGSGSHYLLCRWIPTMESVEHVTKKEIASPSARNDKPHACHCEESSDEAISERIQT